jgi:hypothetical protein
MSAKSILEADGKAILNYHLTRAPVIKPTPLPASATHNPPSNQAEATYPWLLTPGSKFVAKPDQLIKRRGKSGLLALNKTWAEAKEWIEARAGKPQKVETVDGVLRQFLVEPFVPHPQDTEYYININSVREVRSIPSFSMWAVFMSCPWRALRRDTASVQRPFCMCDGWSSRVQKFGCLKHGRLSILFAGRPDEGKYADPLLQSTHVPDTHVHFHMSIHCFSLLVTTLFAPCQFAGSGVAALLCGAFGDRANHDPIWSLTLPLRVIGSSLPTKVV